MKENEAAMALIKLLNKAEFKFSAVDALYFSKLMDWLKDKAKGDFKKTDSMELK